MPTNKIENKNLSAKKENRFPYIIHGCAPTPGGIYPTHTHGIEHEMFINHRSFGLPGNADAINHVYQYLEMNPDAKRNLLGGEIVEWDIQKGGIILCLRKVQSDFAAVQIAYPNCDIDGKVFIQIYVKGDDFALTDEYYLNNEQK